MIFISDAQGNIQKVLPSTVNQNSNLASRIILIAPFSKSVQVSIAFTLPNGSSTVPSLMGANGLANAEFGENYGVWTYDTPQTVTALKGRVEVQFYISNGTQTISTTAQSFEIYSGVDYIEPEITDNAYYDILNALSLLGTNVENLESKTDFLEQSVTDSISFLTEEVEAKADKDTVDNQLAEKVNKSQLATVNGQTLLEGGNITVEGGGGSVETDDALSLESENPVQNKVITEALNSKLNRPTGDNMGIGSSLHLLGVERRNLDKDIWCTSNNIYIFDANNNVNGTVVPVIPQYKIAGKQFSNDGAKKGTVKNTIYVCNPELDYEATPKKWVEDNTTKLYKHLVNFRVYGTNDSGTEKYNDYYIYLLSTSNVQVKNAFVIPANSIILEDESYFINVDNTKCLMCNISYTSEIFKYEFVDLTYFTHNVYEFWRTMPNDWEMDTNREFHSTRTEFVNSSIEDV